jgi:peptidoglycan hydrolase-like protein with peptidoglycan-binding domain
MELAGRDLKTGVAGDDVRELHTELSSLGYAVPPEEQQGSSFGAGTDATVRQFQAAQPQTGIVDAATAAALHNAATRIMPHGVGKWRISVS